MIRLFTVTFVIILLVFLSCDIKNEAAVDEIELSTIALTSTSFRSSTDVVYEEDTVHMAVDFIDNDLTAESLYFCVTSSGGTLVLSSEIGSYAIYNDTTWKTNFSTTGMAVDTYTIETFASSITGKKSNTLTKDFTIQTDVRDSVVDADLTVALDPVTPFEGAAGAEPFRINFTVTNNSGVTIDLVQIDFEIWDAVPTSMGTTFGIVENIADGEVRTAVAKADIPAALPVDSVTFDPDFLIEFY